MHCTVRLVYCLLYTVTVPYGTLYCTTRTTTVHRSTVNRTYFIASRTIAEVFHKKKMQKIALSAQTMRPINEELRKLHLPLVVVEEEENSEDVSERERCAIVPFGAVFFR